MMAWRDALGSFCEGLRNLASKNWTKYGYWDLMGGLIWQVMIMLLRQLLLDASQLQM